jgi:hypothetical protein
MSSEKNSSRAFHDSVPIQMPAHPNPELESQAAWVEFKKALSQSGSSLASIVAIEDNAVAFRPITERAGVEDFSVIAEHPLAILDRLCQFFEEVGLGTPPRMGQVKLTVADLRKEVGDTAEFLFSSGASESVLRNDKLRESGLRTSEVIREFRHHCDRISDWLQAKMDNGELDKAILRWFQQTQEKR